MRTLPLFSILAGTLLSGQIAAQQTLVVGPGNFPDIATAYSAATPGDTIDVQLANATFTQLSGKGIALRTSNGGSVTPQAPVQVDGIPSSQELTIRGDITLGVLSVQNCDGLILLTDIVIDSSLIPRTTVFPEALAITASSNVRLADVAIQGIRGEGVPCGAGGHGISISDSNVALQDCTVDGGSNASFSCSASAGVGIDARNSNVTLHDCFVDAGAGSLVSIRIDGGNIVATAPLYLVSSATSSQQTTYQHFGQYPAIVLGNVNAITDPIPLHVSNLAFDGFTLSLAIGSDSGGVASAPSVFAASPAATTSISPASVAGSVLSDVGGAVLFPGSVDATGSWSQSLSVPPALASALMGLRFYGTGFVLGNSGGLRASGQDSIRF
ncbi:MAG: hypothetical protein AB8H80_21095 [Planctomycetota bacterium]